MLQASSDSDEGPPTLVSIGLDLQVVICLLLHPSDILSLRETCRTFQIVTRQRIVWVTALHRVCVDNCLFLPTFPIPDMSDAELEHAAMAPCRWIELCAAMRKRHPDGHMIAPLRARTTRIIDDTLLDIDRRGLFIVPGGRYLVCSSPKGVFVWDLGYTSSADCKLIASVGPEDDFYHDCIVQATPDGMGLVILASRSYQSCSIYEIYPQSETPQLTQIAYLGFDPSQHPSTYLLPDKALWYEFNENGIVFRIWDYRANHSISFSAYVPDPHFDRKVIATETEIFVLCRMGVLVWAMPPLSPQPLNFFDRNTTYIPSLLMIAFPDGTLNRAEFAQWITMSNWYSGFSQPLYFDGVYWDSQDGGAKLQRFEIIVKPNIFDSFLRIVNDTTDTIPYDYNYSPFQPYRICEHTLVTCWETTEQLGTFTGLTSSRSTAISHNCPAANMLFHPTSYNPIICPTSGRYTHLDDIPGIFVVDLF